MSSQPTGDTQGSAVSASQADEGGAPEPEAAPAGVADPPDAAVPAGARVPAQAAATAGAAKGDAGAASGPAGAAGHSAEPGPGPAAEHSAEPDAGHSAEPGAESGHREPVSKLAVVALVTGVLALVPIAVACAIAALVGIRRTGRRGHGMAIAALFASAAWVIMGGAVGTVAALTHGFKKPVTIKYHESAVFKLREGDCVSTTNGQLVTVLPCTTPHQAEVFATFTLPASAWPGTAALRQDASSSCASRLTAYINPQLAISLAQSYVYPNKVAWTAGTRTVICEVRAASGQLTGSVRGASS